MINMMDSTACPLLQQVDELISLTADLLARKARGGSFSEEDLGAFGGMIKATLEEAWPDMTWSSYPKEREIFGAEVELENNLCCIVSYLIQRTHIIVGTFVTSFTRHE